MRFATAGALVCLVTASSAVDKPRPAPPAVILVSGHTAPGVPLAGVKGGVCAFRLELGPAGENAWKGKLVLDPNPPHYDEFGDPVTGREVDDIARPAPHRVAPVVLDCSLEFVRAGEVRRVNEPSTKRSVYRVKGPKLASPLFFATAGPGLASGRLLVHDNAGQVGFVVGMSLLKPVDPDAQPVPCHPGCFPAGTPVATPAGPRAIGTVKVGDAVTTISADGRAGRVAVEHVFRTTNRLVEVRTDRGPLLTTDAQPLALAGGGFKRAGDLKAGDRVRRWDGAGAEAVVREVAATGRQTPVFNLVLGDSATFVAGGFVARGKPPATH